MDVMFAMRTPCVPSNIDHIIEVADFTDPGLLRIRLTLNWFVVVVLPSQVFSRNDVYRRSRFFQTSLIRSAVKAAEWLQNQQDENGTYGEGHVTAAALHSSGLIGYPVERKADLLTAEIIKNDLGSIHGARLGSYILGAMATCQDPHNINQSSLILALKSKLDKYPHLNFDHPYQYSWAVMALCSSGNILGKKKSDYAKKVMNDINRHLDRNKSFSVDTLSMQVLALTCIKKTRKRRDARGLQKKLRASINKASEELKNRQINDSTFGENEVSAALASQALLAAEAKKTKCTTTMRWLLSRQKPDGSFTNLMATIAVLPTLIGALPFDVQNRSCPTSTTGEEEENEMINVCVELQFEANKYSKGKSPPPRVCVKVLNGTNAHDILKVAVNEHPCYNFTAVNTSWGHMITSICEIEQRHSDKFYWMVKIDGKSAATGIDDLIPSDGSNLLFEYKKLNWGKLIGYPVEKGADVLTAGIIKNDIGSMPGGRVGSYILGAMATCQDPHHVNQSKLIRALKTKLDKYPHLGFNHPFQYSWAVMALCSTGIDLGKKKLAYTKKVMESSKQRLAREEGCTGDTLHMQVLALTCVEKTLKRNDSRWLKEKIRDAIKRASDRIVKSQMNDSTFGENVVTAALASQALLAAEATTDHCPKTMGWLVSRQKPDGSFTNLLGTMYVLPSLIGALPYDLQHIPCPKNTTGVEEDTKMINVCVELQFEVNKYSKGKTPPPRACVNVLKGTNAHDILTMALKEHPCYKFTVKMTSWGRSIMSICDITRRPVDKYYWMIKINGKSATTGIDNLRPSDGSHLLFEYKKLYWGE
ncbi:unnamed protein product [Porites lobata]|uniref:Transcobalamin-like C-terminal domain-containing protein n=1 Tax=Porites lobata TaxID=104759 RepID=A0ABN8NMU1_9CNID|nr:unnamed protein product [Porites lobata]